MTELKEQVDFQEGGIALGSCLREARERAGLSFQAVTDRLHWSPKQIEALEKGDYTQLPEPVYVRGFVRSYAQLLGLDPKKVLSLLPAAPVVLLPESSVPAPHQQRVPLAYLRWALLILGVAVLFAVLLYAFPLPWFKSSENKANNLAAAGLGSQASAVQVASATTILPASAPSAVMNEPPPARVGLYIIPNAQAWVEIRSADGKVYFMGNLPKGDSRDFGAAGSRVTIGNASQVDVWLGEHSPKHKLDLAPYIKGAVARFQVNQNGTAIGPIQK